MIDSKNQTIQSAPAGERDLFAPYRVAGEYCLARNIADDCDYRVEIIDAFTSGAEWQRTQSENKDSK